MTYVKRLVMHGFKSFARKTEIPFDKGINVILGPNGSGKCVTGETIVSLADGSSPRIDELINTKLDNAVRTEDGYIIPGDGQEVLSLDLNSLKIEPKKIKSYVKRTSPKKLLKIKTKSGKEITATKYHPLFILKNGKVVEARADELTSGTRIATPRILPVSPSVKSSDNLDSYIYDQPTSSRTGAQQLCMQQSVSKSQLQLLAQSDIYWDEIVEIQERVGTDWVYDLCVEDHHNFIANNIIVHNSNVSDALCFVLGRLSIKSMRAAKAKNLIFLGSKAGSPSKEAMVEIVFDNEDKTFGMDAKEIAIRRIVRRNGQSIYKINNQTKTRQDVITLLAAAGIDPHGFNLILQGEIQNFVRMKPDDRRGVIEEVSGISVYETRKQKSLKELDKTEDKLKEVSAILRERTSYLNNLEKERQQALRFKKLEQLVKSLKASILNSDLKRKQKEAKEITDKIEATNKSIQKVKESIEKAKEDIQVQKNTVDEINKKIAQASGFEQEKLNREIADIRAKLAGLSVKIENMESKRASLHKQKLDLEESMASHENTLRDLKKEAPMAKKEKELAKKKEEFEELESQRKKFYMMKSESRSLRDLIKSKEASLTRSTSESEILAAELQELVKELHFKKTTPEILQSLRSQLRQRNEALKEGEKRERELEKEIHTREFDIEKLQKIVKDIAKIDTCPLCKSKIDEDHIKSIQTETNPQIEEHQDVIKKAMKELEDIRYGREKLEKEGAALSQELAKREADQHKMRLIEEKKNRITRLQEQIDSDKKELIETTKRAQNLDQRIDDMVNIETKYETAKLEIQEISLRSQETLDTEMSYKQRELDRFKATLKQFKNEEEEVSSDLQVIKKEHESYEKELQKKSAQEEEIVMKNKTLIGKRDTLQNLIRDRETALIHKQTEIHSAEMRTNEFKINKARHDAEIENIETELLSFPNVEIIAQKREVLRERLMRTESDLMHIGSVNLRALEVYDEVKKEYEAIQQKVELIEKEKNGILKVIHEIDVKKKKAFNQTLDALNEIFTRNFTQLSTKGTVSLEVENKKDPFEGGVTINVKTGHGKYFDVTSLSGGEQTLVALSLIFAIQEYSPYHFYILDEIDAALDKRNSERLAGMLKKYMQQGQYIVITHNDEIITNATNLFGVSMHEGVSKITSLKL